MKKILILAVIIIVTILLVYKKDAFAPSAKPTPTPSISSTSTPSPTNMNTPTHSQSGNITVTSPRSEEQIRFPLIITGQARVFENQISYRIREEGGKVLSEGNTSAQSPDVGQFGPYTITINALPVTSGMKLIIEVFDFSAKDGSEIDKVEVPVRAL